MAALMAERGAKLIADDAVDLAPTDLGLMAHASSSMTHLRDGTARAVSSTLGPGSPAADKTAIALPTPTDAVPLRRLYVLGPHREAVVIEPIKRRDAVVELTTHLHRLDLQDPGVLARELDFLELLTSHVPVARLSFPRDFDRRAALVDAVLADVEALR
jgi:hypothetical protein